MADAINVTQHHITITPGVAGGKATIAGRRIRVQDVYVWHEHLGLTADNIAREYNLTLAQVYAALTYAFENLDAIREAIRQSDERVATMKQRYPSRLITHRE